MAATGSTEVDDVVPTVADDRDRAIGRPRGPRRSPRASASASMRVAVVGGDLDDRRAPEPQRHARLLDRAVGLAPRRRPAAAPRSSRPASPRAAASSPAASRAAASAISVRRRGGVGEQPVERRRAGPSASRSQPTTTPSSSVPIGEVRHSIGFWPSAAVSISPRIPGPDAVVAKYARNPGCCQWVAFGHDQRGRRRRGSRRAARAPRAACGRERGRDRARARPAAGPA